jgi:hypothetical protein
VLSLLSISINAFELNADLECLAGVLSWLSIRRNTFKTNADLECRARVLCWLSIRRNTLNMNTDLICRARCCSRSAFVICWADIDYWAVCQLHAPVLSLKSVHIGCFQGKRGLMHVK